MTTPYANQYHLFKAYDIRGARKYFSEDFVRVLSQVFAKMYQTHSAHTVVVGYDMRHGSFAIAQYIAEALCQDKIKVIWLGLVTTPIMAFWANEHEGHGIIATASHSEGHINGLKWLVGGKSPSSQDIQQLYKLLTVTHTHSWKNDSEIIFSNKAKSNNHYDYAPFIDRPAGINSRMNQSLSPTYLAKPVALSDLPLCKVLAKEYVAKPYFARVHSVLTLINQHREQARINQLSANLLKYGHSNTASITHSPLSIVIDCLNGATGHFASQFFSQFSGLFTHVHVINATPDGCFPKGNPDPTEARRLSQLQSTVLAQAADIGLSFDGDGDRLMIVDNLGQVIEPDYLLYLLAQVAITDHTYSREIGQSTAKQAKAKNAPDTIFCPNADKQKTSSLKTGNQVDSLLPVEQQPTVIFDVKCSHHLPHLIQKLGATPLMSKTGNNIMRKALQSDGSKAIFAGELSGHFLFNDNHFILQDDAMYAALRLLNWLAYQPLSIANIISQLPTMVNTADVYLPLNSNDCSNEYSHLNEKPILTKLANLCGRLQTWRSHHLNQQTIDKYILAGDYQASNYQTRNFQARKYQASNFHDYNCIDTDPDMSLSHLDRLRLPIDAKLTCIDGIRLDFGNGFGVVRPSNTSYSLTVRFAGNTLKDLKSIQGWFVSLFELIDHDLACQIGEIMPISYN